MGAIAIGRSIREGDRSNSSSLINDRFWQQFTYGFVGKHKRFDCFNAVGDRLFISLDFENLGSWATYARITKSVVFRAPPPARLAN
jgi:hypothetical protein